MEYIQVKDDYMSKNQVAIIDIGSSNVRLKIFENKKNNIKQLEHVEKPLYLGHDTFKNGQISSEKVDQLCNIINSFKRLASDYSINRLHTYATTAFREADNREYVLELIKLRTGIDVRVLDDLQEKTFIYQELKRLLGQKSKNCVMTYVGSGSLGISVMEKGIIKYSQNIHIGSLKLSEILEPVQGYTQKFHVIVEQYISTYIDVLSNFVKVSKQYDFIATGKEINLLAKLANITPDKKRFTISKQNYLVLYESIKDLTPEQISSKYQITQEQSETLIPSMAMFKIIMDFSNAETFIGYDLSLCDFIGFMELHPEKYLQLTNSFYDDIINQAIFIAKRFNYDEKHAKAIEEYSLKIFDSIKDLHGLKSKHKLLLQIACILHDTGKFLNLKSHYNHSYNIIKNLEIAGLSNQELEIIANVSKYHSTIAPSMADNSYKNLSLTDRMLVSKLSAIIRLGDSLDKSHLQKLENLTVLFNQKELVVSCTFNQDISLEEWDFKNKCPFFKNVFGIKALLMKERQL